MSDMQSVVPIQQDHSAAAGPPSFLAAQIERRLRRIMFGSISIALPNGRRLHREAPHPGPNARLTIRRWRAVWRLITGGDLGFARAYIDGDWRTPDLPALLEFGARNEAALSASTGLSNVARLLGKVKHWSHRNTRVGSRRNIAAHYDLGNAFYAQWLDRGMNYSSALFSRADEPLEAAQARKLDRATALLGLSGGERVLEIGCGWGAMAERLADCSDVTGVTLSVEQLAYARKRLRSRELHADLRLQDYRDVTGTFDRIVSIEMIEAVGEQYWPTYFSRLRDLLENDGVVVIQAITMEERRFPSYRAEPDFIQHYIFPGGMLPTVSAIQREAEKAGLVLETHQSFGESYSYTLAVWRERFLAAWPAI